MTLPSFLIIGAMKAGTTSLYRDLLTNPAVFMPLDKEPNSLTDDAVRDGTGRAEYEELFAPARKEQICGEASTSYTKLPNFAGVPRRAQTLLGGDLKLIYLVREPVARIVSHHHHGLTSAEYDITDIDRAMDAYPELIDWSRYAMQAQAWLESFDRGNLRIVRFETYVTNRREIVAELSAFLGVEPRPDLVRTDEVYNRGEAKPVAGRGMRRFRETAFYRRAIRPLLSRGFRDRFREVMLSKAPPRPASPSPATVCRIYETLRDDLTRLQQLMGLDAPLWDMETIREKHRV